MIKSWPTFSDSMKLSSNYTLNRERDDKWQILEERYNNFKQKDSQQIPKIIHQIWLGSKIPEPEKTLTTSIEAGHKDWKYILWNEANIDQLSNFRNKDLFEQTTNLGQKSDLLRIAILYEYGGVYLDTDFAFIKPFDELLDTNFFCGVAYDSTPIVFNGLIGCKPKHPIIEMMFTLDRELKHGDGTELMDSTGPYFLTRKVFKQVEKDQDILVLPVSFFYPYPNFTKDRIYGNSFQDYTRPETICCHVWASKWM